MISYCILLRTRERITLLTHHLIYLYLLDFRAYRGVLVLESSSMLREPSGTYLVMLGADTPSLEAGLLIRLTLRNPREVGIVQGPGTVYVVHIVLMAEWVVEGPGAYSAAVWVLSKTHNTAYAASTVVVARSLWFLSSSAHVILFILYIILPSCSMLSRLSVG